MVKKLLKIVNLAGGRRENRSHVQQLLRNINSFETNSGNKTNKAQNMVILEVTCDNSTLLIQGLQSEILVAFRGNNRCENF